ncbi:DUF6455 family protein [Shimia sp.]|uniref:DUF6455 family protein n=1 Tax=Shimia sp. TaxID=1954381 RepID=UPI0035668447
MTGPSDSNKPSSDLLHRMAARRKRDLEAEVRSGRMAPEDLSEAVHRCQSCDNPEDCRHWLTREDTAAAPAPLYCRNRELMLKLKAEER